MGFDNRDICKGLFPYGDADPVKRTPQRVFGNGQLIADRHTDQKMSAVFPEIIMDPGGVPFLPKHFKQLDSVCSDNQEHKEKKLFAGAGCERCVQADCEYKAQNNRECFVNETAQGGVLKREILNGNEKLLNRGIFGGGSILKAVCLF